MKKLLSAIILAGGKSSRMGTDKALVTLQNVPLLEHICKVAQAVTNSVYIVTPWGERYQEILPPECKIIPEAPTLNSGPLVAFAGALAVVETDWVLLLACDLPLLEASEVERWVKLLAEVPNDAMSATGYAYALLPRNAKGWEPLCGFYRRSCLPLLEDYIHQGGKSFQGWLASQTVAELVVSNEKLLFNCNTQGDLNRARHLKGTEI